MHQRLQQSETEDQGFGDRCDGSEGLVGVVKKYPVKMAGSETSEASEVVYSHHGRHPPQPKLKDRGLCCFHLTR
jgi:hypothetical protein